MKKQLFLTALMSVTAFSAQASVGLAATKAATVLATALLAGDAYLAGLIAPDHVRNQTLYAIGQVCGSIDAGLNSIVDAAAGMINTGTIEVVKIACDNGTKSSFVRNTVITGTLAAATYYGIKAMQQAKNDDALRLPRYVDRTPGSFAVALEGINNVTVHQDIPLTATPPIGTAVKSLAEELRVTKKLVKKNN